MRPLTSNDVEAGAPPATNRTGETVYLPRAQRFDKDGLLKLMGRFSRKDHPSYGWTGAAI